MTEFVMIAAQLALVSALALVHVFAGKVKILDVIPRSNWLSLAGGVSVAYVFVHILPELEEAQTTISGAGGGPLPFLEHHAYLVALLGLAVSYGLERVVQSAQSREGGAPGRDGETTTGEGVFWLHISFFAIYNALIGYLLMHRESQDARGLAFFFAAMAFHFLVNDHGLRQDHRNTYRRTGRWLLGAAIFVGWLAGLATDISEAAVGMLFAFLAGGVILNVLKEELPEERKSRFWPFAVGAASYAALLLAV